ncbi:MAG: PC4/YdbC family ssDNA-binding protein [Erysipelotrichaceae bacterium]|nr:PC4/YdbC family ssDNA-binding protein [Erysipelotrichaceae bacterium]
MPEFKYEINKQVAVLSEKGDYTTEVNVITYGEHGKPKLDIRKWNRAEDRMQKGITLSKEEAAELFEALKSFDFEQLG